MKKNYMAKMLFALMLGFFGLANANAQFLENAAKVEIVQIPAFDNDGAKAQRYLADVDDVVLFATEQNEASQWYKIPAGGVSDGTADVQAYYYKNVATGKYLGINEATLTQLATERGGDWPTEPAATYVDNDKSLGFKWFDRPSPWSWGIFLSNAAGIDLTARENNQIYSLTSITIMKNEGEEFFGVYFPNAAVGGFAGGGGNAWTAVKIPVVVESEAANPDYFPENTATVDIVQIPAFDGDGAKAQRYLADVDDVVLFATEQNEASQWYKIPAGGVSDGTADVQAYYYKNVATGKYLGINEATLTQLATERGGDWPTEPAATYVDNDKSLGFKWFDRLSPWGWGIYLSNAAGIDLTARENNQIYSLTSITIMKNEGEEFFGVYFPNAAVGGFAGGGGNAWTAVKIPVVVESGALNPDYDGPDAPKTCLDLSDLTFLPDGTSYDAETKTITYSADWKHAGWEWEEPQDFSQYQKVRFEFDGTGLPGAETGETKIQLIVMYDGGRFDGDEEVEVRNNVTTADVILGVRGDIAKVKKIAIKSQTAGTIILQSVCLVKQEPVIDLIVTDVRWEPVNPSPGDQVTFFATIKNIGEATSPSGVKHGVVFQVNNATVSWSDGFFGPIPGGGEVEVSSRMEGSSGALWTCGDNPTYNIRAWVNDTRDVQESNYDNNYSETKVLSIGTGINEILAGNGNVYYANGALHVINYPSSAVLQIYNLLGGSVSGSRFVSGIMNVNLSPGIYVIKIRSEGKTFTHKVIVK